jgi:hypothetical protein
MIPFTDVHPLAMVSTNSDPLDLRIALLVKVELARLRIYATQAEPCALRADGTNIDRQPLLHWRIRYLRRQAFPLCCFEPGNAARRPLDTSVRRCLDCRRYFTDDLRERSRETLKFDSIVAIVKVYGLEKPGFEGCVRRERRTDEAVRMLSTPTESIPM